MFSKKNLIKLLPGGCLILSSCIDSRSKELNTVDYSKAREIQSVSSLPLDSLIKVLLLDNYELTFDTAYNSTVRFVSYQPHINSEETLLFNSKRIITIKAHSAKDKNTKSRFSFAVQQIIPAFTENSRKIKERIEKMISNPGDSINSALFDRISLDKGAIYYILTPAREFEQNIIEYDQKLEKIIDASHGTKTNDRE
jgi:hypothetical protein